MQKGLRFDLLADRSGACAQVVLNYELVIATNGETAKQAVTPAT